MAGYENPPEALVNGAEARSGIALALGNEPRAIVHMELDMRKNHGDETYTAHLAMDPDLAQELGRALIGAAKASRLDLEEFKDKGLANG